MNDQYNPTLIIDQIARAYKTKRVQVVEEEPSGAAGNPGGRTSYKVVATENVNAGDVLLIESALAYESYMKIAGTKPELHPMYNLFHFHTTQELQAHEGTLEEKLRRSSGFNPLAWSTTMAKGNNDLYEDIAVSNALPLVIATGALTYGRGLFFKASRINHSCDPNAEYLSQAQIIILYARRPISQGEEVTLTYMSEICDCPRPERQHFMQLTNGFLCTCARCLGPEPELTERQYRLYSKALNWRKLAFDLVPELAGEAYEQGIHSRAKALLFTKLFLERNMAALLADDCFTGTRNHVTRGVAMLLTPQHPRVLLKDAAIWLEVFRLARTLFVQAAQKTRWYMGLAYCARIIILGHFKGQDADLLLPALNSPMALLAAAQYLWYATSTNVKEQYMIQLLLSVEPKVKE